MAEAIYQIRARDTDGLQVALFVGEGRGETGGGLQQFWYRKRLRTPGGFTLQVDGFDDRIADIELDDGLDYLFEFWRRDILGSLDWYKDATFFTALTNSPRMRKVEKSTPPGGAARTTCSPLNPFAGLPVARRFAKTPRRKQQRKSSLTKTWGRVPQLREVATGTAISPASQWKQMPQRVTTGKDAGLTITCSTYWSR